MKISKKTIKNKKIQQERIKKIKCGEFYKCSEKECPAYKSKNLKCWLYTGTCCRKKIQGKFIDKMEMCVDCKVFKKNMDSAAIRESYKVFNKQLKDVRELINKREWKWKISV